MIDTKAEEMVEADAIADAINDKETFELSDVEMETLRRAALERSLCMTKDRRIYTRSELSEYGIVRVGLHETGAETVGIRARGSVLF